MHARRLISIGVLAALGAFGAPTALAWAQPGVDISRARPPSGIDSFVTLNTTRTPGHLNYSVAATFDYSLRPLILQREAGDQDLITDRYRLDLGFEIGLGSRLAVAVDLPFVLHQNVTRGAGGDLSRIQSGGFGDPRVIARLRLVGDATPASGELPDGPGLALAMDVTVPAGTQGAFAGDGAVTVGAAVLGDFHLLGLAVGGRLGWRQRSRQRLIAGVRFREELELGLGARMPIPWLPHFDVRAEIRVATDGRSPFSSKATTPVETELSFGLRRGDLLLTSGVGFGLTAAVGSPRVRALLSLAWAPTARDADGDGIDDDVDQCPHLPEDMDGFQDDDGCMDPDNDNDFVPDTDDRCPNEEALEGRDADEDGCTDPARDSDGDGVDDAADACPREMEDMNGVEDDDGCADAVPPTPTPVETDTATPDGTTPDATTPDATMPDATMPDGTTPDGTTLDATPDGTTPDGTTPDATTPDGTTPDGTTPDGTTPDDDA